MNTRTVLPTSLPELFSAWADTPDARLLAGGTDLLVRLRDELEWPPLIDISRVNALRGIEADTHTVRIGALTTYAEIERSSALAACAPVLVDAARLVGSPQIRNRGTLGGNLANASPAGDLIPPLYVLAAHVVVTASHGTRRIAVDEFFKGPGRTDLAPHELVTAVEFTSIAAQRGIFLRLGQREALAISKVSLALTAVRANSTLHDIRIALGAVAPTVVRARGAESCLADKVLGADTIRAACAAVENDAAPIDDIRSTALYRRAMCRHLLERAVHQLLPTRG